MTDKQRLTLLRSARDSLERTEVGFVEFDETGRGSNWRTAMNRLHKLERDLLAATSPPSWADIGSFTKNGPSVLDMSPTHNTDGLPTFVGIDTAWGAGTSVYAPEPITIDTKDSSANPGEAFYATGKSRVRYWIAHLDRDHPLGKTFATGAFLGKTVPTTIGGGPHAHIGVNVEAFLGKGKILKYGRNGNGPDYTLGSPTVRAQLAGKR